MHKDKLKVKNESIDKTLNTVKKKKGHFSFWTKREFDFTMDSKRFFFDRKSRTDSFYKG